MSIFLNKDSKVIVQGITGGEGTKHTALMLKAGTQVVGGVNARKAGTTVTHGDVELPVFGTVAEAMSTTGADVSIAFVPPAFTKDAMIEAIDAGIAAGAVVVEGEYTTADRHHAALEPAGVVARFDGGDLAFVVTVDLAGIGFQRDPQFLGLRRGAFLHLDEEGVGVGLGDEAGADAGRLSLCSGKHRDRRGPEQGRFQNCLHVWSSHE